MPSRRRNTQLGKRMGGDHTIGWAMSVIWMTWCPLGELAMSADECAAAGAGSTMRPGCCDDVSNTVRS